MDVPLGLRVGLRQSRTTIVGSEMVSAFTPDRIGVGWVGRYSPWTERGL